MQRKRGASVILAEELAEKGSLEVHWIFAQRAWFLQCRREVRELEEATDGLFSDFGLDKALACISQQGKCPSRAAERDPGERPQADTLKVGS